MKKHKERPQKKGDFAGAAVEKGAELAADIRRAIVEKMDYNGDGVVDISDIIVQALKIPGVHIDRAKFLQKELFKNHPQRVIDNVINYTPAIAGIPAEEIDKIANEVIKAERIRVSGISAALGLPGGLAMAATIPADILQYYGCTLRAAQKLMYLYGFPEIGIKENELYLDSETTNILILCLGVMNGVAGANNAIKAMAKALGVGVEKKLLRMALTKGAFYPFIKGVLKWFGVGLTKEVFAGFFKKAIPVAGGMVGGGITFATFKPCCLKLVEALRDTMLSNPEHIATVKEDAILDSIMKGEVIDVDYESVASDECLPNGEE